MNSFRFSRKFVSVLLLISFLCLGSQSVVADQSSSTSYQMEGSVSAGHYATSSGFSVYSLISGISVSTTSSATFSASADFIRYPFASTPIISATAGTGSVELSWTSSVAGGGWTASSYSVGKSTTNGGPYSFTNVGNTTSSTQSSLTAGVRYYFIVRVHDALGNSIATSTEVSAVPAAASVSSGGTSGGSSGGGGGGITGSVIPSVSATVIFSGKAYPKTVVTLLKDAQVAGTVTAAADATFHFSLPSVASGNYMFSLYSEDKYGNRSSLLSFPVNVSTSATKEIDGIFIAPTITTDKSQVKKGDDIAIFGQTTPNGEVSVTINSDEEHLVRVQSDKDGIYLLHFKTDVLEIGEHHTRSMVSHENEVSTFSKSVAFEVGSKNVAKQAASAVKGDLNADRKVNLVDFSIAAFWYKKTLDSKIKQKEIESLNGDGKINLVDFSIMAFNWTG